MRCPLRNLLLAAAIAAAATAASASASASDWGLPDLGLTTAWYAQPAAQPATLLVVPDGSGPPLSQARLVNGQVIDRIVHLQAIDELGWPLNQLAPDGWALVWQDGGVHACGGSPRPDRATGPDGMTEWAQPLRAGGQSRALVRVTWFGMALETNGGLVLQVNSPDLNGDLAVDLMDVVLFAQDFFGHNNAFRSDLHFDGVVNLSDIVELANHVGAHCP